MNSTAGRPLRICLVSAAYRPYPSGVSEHVHHLALELRRLGQDVSILTTNFPDTEDSTGPVPVTRIGRAVLVPMNRSYATVPIGLRMRRQVKTFLDSGTFDVVHCHGMYWPEIAYWAIRHSRSVNVVTFVTAGFRIHTFGSSLFQKLFRCHLAKIHGRIAISSRARQAALPYVPGEYRIIPCGVDLERFKPGLKRSALYEEGRPSILFLGRLDHRKGIDALLRAMPRVLGVIPGALAVVVGRGPMERTARRLVSSLGIGHAVRFAGAVSQEQLPGFYAGCDVFCSPASGGETLGIVLLEAMASGAPVVASRIPGYDETVRDGIDGLLCPPREPERLAETLTLMLKNTELRRRFSASGLERARAYAWPVVARRTLDFYLELLSSTAPAA
jgi:phosphatidylinositol alpha-mannosyltransferase